MNSQTAIVIGAGFGGLATAALLAKQGYSVTVLEKNEGPGGRASVWREQGFTFDLGPSWYLMRDVFNRFFGEFGKKDSDFFTVERLDPSYRIFFDSKTVIDISADVQKNIALFDSLEVGGGTKLAEYLVKARTIYESSMDAAVYTEVRSLLDFVRNPKLRQSGKDLPLLQSFDQYVSSYFSSETAKKILEYTIVFLGGSPKNTPAIYSLMAHVDFNLGVWFPKGGIGQVVKAIEDVGKELGVQYEYGCDVSRLEVVEGVVKKVHTSQGIFEADIVVSNADLVYSETRLLEKKYQTYPESYWKHKKIAPSAYVMYLGLNKKLPQLSHHTLFLQHDWMHHFEEIFNKPAWPDKPSYYVNCPSFTDESLAPPGCENIFILVPVAPGLDDSDEIREQYFSRILHDFEVTVGENISDSIIVKRIFSHRDFSARYNAYKGTALGLAHTLTQSSIFRPAHTSKKVSNLYYVGQYTNPGIGMPMCLISAMQLRDILVKK